MRTLIIGGIIFIALLTGAISRAHKATLQKQRNKIKTMQMQLINLKKQLKAVEKEAEHWKAIINTKGSWLAIDSKTAPKIVEWVLQKSSKCPTSLARTIVSWCDDKKLCFVLLSVIQVESHFDPYAVSKTGAIGLGQIMPLWVPELKTAGLLERKRDLYDPLINITCTEYILKKYMAATNNNLTKALYKYTGNKNKKYVKSVYANIGELMVLIDFN